MSDIVYVCHSINNKNVRGNELKILRRSKDDNLCFEFGENEINLKKRFYKDEATLQKDFKELQEIAKKQLEEKTKKTSKENLEEENLEEDNVEKYRKNKNMY